MGRTATAFLVLAAVGGCVADDQGPAAAILAAQQQGRPVMVAVPSYATWNKSDQFVVVQDNAEPQPPAVQAPPAPPAPVHVPAATTVLKPAPVHKPVIVPAPAVVQQAVAPPPPTVDPDLVQATLVQTPANPEPVVREAPAAPKLVAASSEGEPAPAKALPSSTRMVNTKRITLNYELNDVGATGVAGVELWCTQDAKAWQKGEIIAQTNHSYTVEVKDEGLYGFTLLARNGSGAGLEAPKAGDQPQVWVSVSVTKPVVQITGLERTHAGKAPGVLIRWTAKDKDFGPRPINLLYAEESEGPWTPIAAGLENNGQYEWQPTGVLPHHLYVRVEAADLHGNVGMGQTANPLRIDAAAAPLVALAQSEPPPAVRKPLPLPAPPALDASRPSAAILGVEPNGN